MKNEEDCTTSHPPCSWLVSWPYQTNLFWIKEQELVVSTELLCATARNSLRNTQKCLNQQKSNLRPKKAVLRKASGFTCFTLVQHPELGCNSLEDDGRHGDLKEFLLEGNKGQQTSVEQAKEQEDTLGTEDGGNVRVLQQPGKRFSVILVDFDLNLLINACLQFSNHT